MVIITEVIHGIAINENEAKQNFEDEEETEGEFDHVMVVRISLKI